MFRAAIGALVASPAGGLLRGSDQQHLSAEKHAVFAMACSYDRQKMAPFVLSLRETAGFAGEVHLGVYSDIDPEAADFLRSHHVTMHNEPCDEQAHAKEDGEVAFLQVADGEVSDGEVDGPRQSFFMGSLNQRRWFHYKNWILDNDIDRVWMLDVRDVIFQANPFTGQTEDLLLFPDDDHLTKWQRARLRRCLGARTWKAMNATAMPNWCGGTISGSRQGVVQLCDSMIELNEQMKASSKAAYCTVNDQPLINHMAFKYGMTDYGKAGSRVSYTYWHGPALNMNNLCDELDAHRNAEGQLVDVEGNVIPIVHKWDKCQSTRDFVSETYA